MCGRIFLGSLRAPGSKLRAPRSGLQASKFQNQRTQGPRDQVTQNRLRLKVSKLKGG